MAQMLAPLVLPTADALARQEVALGMAAAVVAIGSRRVVANLARSTLRLRQANIRDRRHARQLAAVEEVGRLLAREGPSADALDGIMGVLEETFGYRYPSVYVWDGRALQLGAQRNYQFPIQTVTPDRGVLGRIVRTRQPAFLPDARNDPDFLSADPDVVSEISIPLQVDGELLGVLNVETSGDHRLADDDFATMQIVGDRLAAALALGRERQKLTERAALLDRLTVFATVLGSSLDPATMDDEVASGAVGVIPADMVVVINLDEPSGAYRIAPCPAATGGRRAGRSIPARGSAAGRSSSGRSSSTIAWSGPATRRPSRASAAGRPRRDGRADGRRGQGRRRGHLAAGDLTRPFTSQEREVAELLAGRAGLALANARLHQQTRAAAITDPLTGMHNRRHFDSALEREDALRRRTPAEKRRMRSAILFDLDHFGRVNKQFGHQVGDRVLRLFADTLRARARSSDLVARYGGEEFVVILENASRDDAMSIADEVRSAFSQADRADRQRRPACRRRSPPAAPRSRPGRSRARAAPRARRRRPRDGQGRRPRPGGSGLAR